MKALAVEQWAANGDMFPGKMSRFLSRGRTSLGFGYGPGTSVFVDYLDSEGDLATLQLEVKEWAVIWEDGTVSAEKYNPLEQN